MTAEVNLQEQEPADTGGDLASVDALARTAEADAQAELGQRLRAADIPEQASTDRDDGELANGPAAGSGDAAEALADTDTTVDGQPAVPRAGDTVRGDLGKRALEAPSDQAEAAPANEQPRSPYYEQLQQQGDAGVALEPYLTRLATTVNDYCDRVREQDDEGADELDRGLLDRLGDADGAQGNKEVGQLTDVLGHSLRELQAHPELVTDGETNWLGLGTSLLDRAAALGEDADERERQGLLVSATTASLMAESPDDRIAFLRETAARGLGQNMEVALDKSDVTVILDPYRNSDMRRVHGSNDRSIHRIRNFGNAFLVDTEQIDRYQQLVERDLGEPADAHAVMKNMVAEYATADGALSSDHAETLEDASVAAPYVDKYRIDPTKAERFALEEMYVQAQMGELFPNGDTTNLRTELAAVRPDDPDLDVNLQLKALFGYSMQVIDRLSRPATERFNVPEGQPDGSWTPEQLAAWRYRQLSDTGAAYEYVAKFADPSIAGQISNFNADIYSISENGAAIPGMTTEAIRVVLHMADEYTAATGDRVSPAELRDLTQANRRQLMKVAAINIDFLSASLVSGKIRNQLPYDSDPASPNDSRLYRRPDGALALEGPLFQPEKEVSSQSAARLACVALRVNVEHQPEAADAPARGRTNSIELLAETIIDEAYERGIFGKEPLLTREQEAEFNRMYQQHHSYLVGLARNWGIPAQDVEDIVQETFLKAARVGKIFNGDPGHNERAYLSTTAQNTVINNYRRAHRQSEPPVVVNPEANDLGLENAVQPGPRVEDLVASNDVRERLFGEWQELMPDQHFKILILTEYYGMSYKETAATLGIPIGSVMSGLSRAKARIREHEKAKAERVPVEA